MLRSMFMKGNALLAGSRLIKNFVFWVGIIIVFGLVLWQGIEAFYPSPQYDDYCDRSHNSEVIDNAQSCVAVGGQWSAYDGVRLKSIEGEDIPDGWCDRDYTCRQEHGGASDEHSKVVFIISLIVGLIVLFVGYSYLSVEPVGSALIGSGIWAIFWGSVVNWRNFSSVWRFLLLLFALILLIWLALKLNSVEKSSKKSLIRRILGK